MMKFREQFNDILEGIYMEFTNKKFTIKLPGRCINARIDDEVVIFEEMSHEYRGLAVFTIYEMMEFGCNGAENFLIQYEDRLSKNTLGLKL